MLSAPWCLADERQLALTQGQGEVTIILAFEGATDSKCLPAEGTAQNEPGDRWLRVVAGEEGFKSCPANGKGRRALPNGLYGCGGMQRTL
jgi:hypothetical protein